MHDQPAAGEVVTETLDYDGGRLVTVYVPADPPEAVVFAGDGQLISQWGGVLEAADVPSTMIVGVHRLADETDDGPAAHLSPAGNGWGLAIVADVTDRTGAAIQAEGHRTAWAEVT